MLIKSGVIPFKTVSPTLLPLILTLDFPSGITVLCKRMRLLYPQMLSERYKLGDMSQYEEFSDYDLFLTIGRKRGFLISGGEINTERTAIMLLDEFRACKLGRITLDRYSKEELHA